MTVVAERVAHGGHVVARHERRVLFVRHALPGERVEAVITAIGPRGRFARADAVRVLDASPDRVVPPCPHSGPGRCGGCDWQHASLIAQRRLKAEVLREQLARLGGVDDVEGVPLADAVDVEAVAGDTDGLGWRTRVRFAVTAQGELGLRRFHSHDLEVVGDCPLATPGVRDLGLTALRWPGATEVEAIRSSTGDAAVVLEPPSAAVPDGLPREVAVAGRRGRRWVSEEAGGRSWRVSAAGFWQVHPGAAGTLVDAVRGALGPRPGEHLVDLYAGVGLFAGCLAPDLGPQGRVDAVEASPDACRDARRNLHDLPTVAIHEGDVGRWLRAGAVQHADLVVLDPPRSGAGAAVLDRVAALGPRAVAYVACDPAALGRDVGHLRQAGWRLASVRGFDLFPMTHHLEAVALLLPPSS
ncbi:MAG: class I SAM-dependent RNA methyltransferase [Frankiales bacterium]|nr:class I SAM-dependent RNA methyltransferase [Frankiales bacterium]